MEAGRRSRARKDARFMRDGISCGILTRKSPVISRSATGDLAIRGSRINLVRMRIPIIACGLLLTTVTAAPLRSQADSAVDPVQMLVGRLDLELYKATIKGLTQFGDRRQGT